MASRRDGAADAVGIPVSDRPGVKPLLVLTKIRGILDAFSPDEPMLTLGEIRARTGFPMSTVQRLVANLVAEEFLDRAGDKLRIGVRLVFWAAPTSASLTVLDAVSPGLEELRDLTGETASFFRREGRYRVCVALAETRHPIRRAMHIGMVLPLHAGSAGRVLLAWDGEAEAELRGAPLAKVTPFTVTDPEILDASVRATRSAGYAITADERDEGAIGVSVPVFDAMAQVVGSLTVSGPSFRLSRETMERWTHDVVRVAERTTRILGGRRPAADG